MSRFILTAFLCSCLFTQADDFKHQTLPNDNPDMVLSHFAFGSCWKATHSQDHWAPIIANKPQFWLWLGDNIYADTNDMDVLRKKYSELGATKGYRELAASCPILATWDDHDFGQNDVGADYPHRAESKEIFLKFFNERPDSARNKREGVYTSYYFGKAAKRVQLILLDTRYFRSPLKRIKSKPPYRRMGKWEPDTSPDATILGSAQWAWLEEELKKPARIRLIGSSIQFAAPHNGHEAWLNMPNEYQRMIDLIKKTKAEGVVFLSGDIHSSELCIAEPEGCYPLIDYTSSSLNLPLGILSTHRRTGPAYGGSNFGTVNIDWEATDPVISISTKDKKNDVRLHHSVSLSNLTFKKENLISYAIDGFAGEWQTFYGPMTIQKMNNQWTATCADRKAELTLTGKQLAGTWTGGKQHGKVTFELTRDGRFLRGAYSYEDLPLQLDWAAWKADWEKHFKRDDYKAKKK